ncbi:MAG: MFS transporter [Elusimicrobiota bacterium]
MWLAFNFFIAGFINLFIFLIGKSKVRFEEVKKEEKINFKEIIFYSVFLFSFIYGVSRINTPDGVFIFLISFLFLYIVYSIEKISKYHIINILKFKNNTPFIFSNLAAIINYTATSAITFFLSIYLQSIHSMTPKKAGSILLVQPLIMCIISPFAGKLSDSKEPQLISSLGMGITTLSLLMLCFLGSGSSINYVILILLIAGIGFGLFSSPNTNAVMSSAQKEDYTTASGILATSRVIGQSLSMGIASLSISIFMSGKQFIQYQQEFIKSLNFSFLIFTILSLSGIFFSLKRGKIHNLYTNTQDKNKL